MVLLKVVVKWGVIPDHFQTKLSVKIVFLVRLLNVACKAQTYFRSSLLSLRKYVCVSQATVNET